MSKSDIGHFDADAGSGGSLVGQIINTKTGQAISEVDVDDGIKERVAIGIFGPGPAAPKGSLKWTSTDDCDTFGVCVSPEESGDCQAHRSMFPAIPYAIESDISPKRYDPAGKSFIFNRAEHILVPSQIRQLVLARTFPV